MSVTDTQLQALVHLAVTIQHRARGDRKWDEAGLAAEIRKLNDQALSADEIIDRTLAHARNPKCKTPASLRWPADGQKPLPVPNREPVEECPLHPGKPAVACVTCAADALAGEPPRSHGGRRLYDPETGERLKHRPLRELVHEHSVALAPPTDTTEETKA